nr:RNA-directed DNA polymerase, eukaryota [Tanacetum cinerariifolium]
MNQSENKAVENTTVDDGTIESVPKNMSLSGFKHGHVDSLASFTKPINAKIKWAIEGDENSKFFYDIVNKKRRQQAIKGILVDSKWIDNPGRLKREFYNHFANKFSALDWSCVSMEGIFPRHIGFKVNMYKSSLYGLGVHSLDVQSMANKFGRLANNLLFTYLGVKVAANMTRTSS